MTGAEIDAEIAATKAALTDVHGSECEVYARIVGYYRSVKNWNKGKKDEYKIRSMFDEPSAERMTSKMPVTDEHCDSCAMQQVAVPKATSSKMEIVHSSSNPHQAVTICNRLTYRLFYRTTCPNCPPVKTRMEDIAGGELVNVDTDEGLAAAMKEGVLAAPTVIFYDANSKETARAHNVDEIDEVLGVKREAA